MKILTAILDPTGHSEAIPDIYEIIPNTWHNVNDYFEQTLRYADGKNEDVVFFVKNSSFLQAMDLHKLEKIILDIAQESINFLYKDVEFFEKCEGYVVNDDIICIDSFSAVNSFFIFRPLFNFVLSLINNSKEIAFKKLIDVTKIFSKHNFMLSLNTSQSIKHQIHVISPFRNVSAFIRENANSILMQEHKQFKIHYIDDCSDDNSADLIPKSSHIFKISNTTRQYALQNIVELLLTEKFDDEDIICLVDADDILPHKYVLNILNDAYNKKNVSFIYGAMTYINEFEKIGYSYTADEFADVRNSNWKLSPVRSFKYKLFKELVNQDPELETLKDSFGNYFKMPYDMALYFPLLEIAGYENVSFINTPLYAYRSHENNDHVVNRDLQYMGEVEVRKKKPLNRAF